VIGEQELHVLALVARETDRLRAEVSVVIWGEKASDEDVEPRGGDLRRERSRAVRNALIASGASASRLQMRHRSGQARVVLEVEGCSAQP
jgi:hypothetical protein